MSRFLARADWPLIVAGVIAGLLTIALVLYLFVTGIGGRSALDPSLFDDTTRIISPDERHSAGRRRGVVALREIGVSQRLAKIPAPSQALRGPLSWTARNIVWNERGGVRFARAEAASGRLLTAGLGVGDYIVENVVLRRPVVSLREERSGSWNYERVLAELLDGDQNGNGNGEGGGRLWRKPTIQVRALRIVSGQVDVQRPDDRFAFYAVEGQLPVVSFTQPGIAQPYVRIARISGVFDRPARETRLPVTVANGIVHFPSGEARFDLETVLLDETRLADVSGVWNSEQPAYGVTATGRAVAARFEDIRFLAPDRLPETGTASFAWSVRPVGPDGTEVSLTELDARSGDSRVRGAVAFTVRPEQSVLRDADLQLDPLQLALVERFTGPLPYGGTLTGRVLGTGGDIRFDLTALLTTEALSQPFNAQLTGRVRLADTGILVQQVDIGLDRVPMVALRAIAPGLPFSGVVTGQVSLRGPPNRAPLELDVRLELGNGVAQVAGTLDLTGAVPRYDLTGRVVGVDLQAVLEPDVPPVFLTANFELAGTGTDPATADARLRLAGRFTGWEATPQDTVDLDATFRSGVAHVQSLALRLATAELAGRGEWRFVEPVNGAVTYQLAVSSLEPFGPYLPSIGDTISTGSFEAKGSLTGSLQRMRLAGELSGTGVRVGDWAASSFASRYDVTVGAAVPDAVVELDSRGLETPIAGNYAAARLSLRLRAPDLHIEFNADQHNGGKVEVLATGEIPPTGERRALVERARVDLGRGQWQLVRPAEIRWGGADGLTVGNLELATEGSPGRVLVNGRILPLENADARVNIAHFPVGELLRLLGQEPYLEGSLSADGTVRGGTSPVVDLEFRVENGSLEQVPLTRLDGQLTYRDQQTQLHVVAAMDTAGSLELDVRLPSTLRLAADPDFDLIDGAPLEGSLTANRFTLTPFRAVLPARARDLRGYIDGTARLAGTAAQPRLEGTLALREGYVRIPEANQSFSEITGRIGFAESRIVLEELRVRSEGWLTARGTIVLEELTNPVVSLTVDLDAFRPVGVPDERDAAVYGSVSLTGPPDGLVLTGNLRVEDGYVVLPQMGGGLDRGLIDITRPAPVMGQQVELAEGNPWIRNLRIDNLRVRVGSNTWFLAEEARVELRGTLTINKVRDAMPIVGTLEGERGQYTLVAGPLVRRFDVVAAEVRFVGTPEPNPYIDFTARRIIIDASGREVNVDVRITGTLDRPNINLASGELASMPESELLSFLLFGQPSFELGGELPGDGLLQQTFVGGFAELAALELERELGGVGLDIFQIRLGGGGSFGGLGTPTLVAGRQLADDVFITVETGISALFGETFALRLDWAFDRRSRARLALEPVHSGRTLRPGLALPLTPRQPKQQLLLEVRRRWEW